MALTYGFYNSIEGDRKYDATQISRIFDGIIKDGVYATYEKGMVVIASTNPGEVIIQPGRAWFNHTWSYNDANVIFPAPEPEVLLDRIDALVLEINEELASRENSFKWVQGTPSSVPERPTLTNTPTIHQYPLCYIHRYPEITTIQAKDITSMVGTSECPFATGVLEGIDLDAWINQWDDEFHNWENTTKSSFETWMLNQEATYTAWSDALKSQMDGDVEDVEAWIETIKNIIDSETATHLQNEIDELREEITSGSHIFIHTINSELYGRNVTITTEEGIIYTERFDNTGVAEFKSIPYVGNLNVVSSYGTQTAEAVINTPYFARYNFNIAFWAATVNIVGIPDYAGQTVTIKDSASVIADTVVLNSDGNGVFTAIRPDTYTFTLIYGGETMETTLSVTQETTYTVEIHSQSSINLQDWLTAGGVTGTYNTFADVEADEKAVRRLMTIHDAVDYLAQSDGTDELISEVINSDICAKWINLRDYALDTLSANTDIKALMDTADKYGYGEWVLEGQVPVMTSNTEPYGKVLISPNTSATYNGWYAFSDTTNQNQEWASGQIGAGYLGYHFVRAVNVTQITLKNGAVGNDFAQGVKGFKIQYSDDGTNWSDAYEGEAAIETVSAGTLQTFDFDSVGAHSYWRLYVISHYGSNNTVLRKLQFYAWQPKGNVPIMTSNTAPYGEASAYSSQSSHPAYTAFNKTKTTFSPNDAIWWENGRYGGTSWLQYKFVNPICVKRCSFIIPPRVFARRYTSFIIKASNDGTNFETIYTPQDLPKTYPADDVTYFEEFNFENDGFYLYYRLETACDAHDTANLPEIGALQFYGREMKVSVPTMTSNTAPWGEARYVSGQRYSSDSYEAYRLFDKNNNIAATTGVPSASSPHILAYSFGYPVVVKEITFKEYGNSSVMLLQSLIKDFIFIGSNDNFATYDELGTFESVSVSGKIYTYTINNNTTYKAYGIKATSNNGYSTYTNFGTMGNFYGFDYSEYDWDTENPRHYLYDHGVELETLTEVDNGGSATEITKGSDSFEISSTSSSAVIGALFRNIQLTDYSLFRAVIGEKAVYNANLLLVICPLNFTIGTAANATYTIAATNSPSNHFLAVDTFNESKDVGVLIANAICNCVFTELWLE